MAESPTQGVDRLSLKRALELADALRKPANAAQETTRRINIIAPSYSGSLPSLRDGLRDWLAGVKETSSGKYTIEILSGSASAFDQSGFVAAIQAGQSDKLADVSFFSMTHRFEQTLETILRFLGRSNHGEDVAILSEIDTGFGESVSHFRAVHPSGTDPFRTSIRLQYPSQIAEIRRRYELQGLMKDETSSVLRSAADLRARGDAEREAIDIFPDQVPDWTALSENRVLTQALRYLEDSRVKVVGIIGTDPRDIVFLARLIRLYCPDARIFTVGSDLLYLDSLSIADLRGMIVGSTYPLYPANHSWTGSDTRSRGQVFPSENAQGVYNAAVVQIARVTGRPGSVDEPEGENGEQKPWEAEGERLVEYSTPVPLRGGVVADPALPPVWISVVGERSLYPVDCRPLDRDQSQSDFKYLYHARPALSSPGRLVINRAVPWVIFLASASLVLLISYFRRLRHAVAHAVASRPPPERRAPTDELALALARVLILAGYLYVACPALAQLIPGTVELNVASGWWSSGSAIALALAPIVVTLSALLAMVAEFRTSHSPWRAAEALGLVLVVVMVAYVQVTLAGRLGGS